MQAYKHPAYARYFAPWVSVASVWSILVYLGMLSIPFFLAYATYGFWKKDGYYFEQPIVVYTHKLAVLLQSSAGILAFSTIPEFNQMSGFSKVRIPQVQSYMSDPNLDGRNDFFNLTLTFPLNVAEKVYGVSALVFFDVELKDRVKLDMTSLTYTSKSSNLAGAKLSAFGNLEFSQLYPLSLRGSRTNYNSKLLDGSNILSNQNIQFDDILASYFSRNETLQVDNSIEYWTPGTEDRFVLDIRYRIPQSQIWYIPGPGEVLKFSWMQYVAVGVLVWFILDWLLYVSHKYAFVSARRVVDYQPKVHKF